MNILLLTQFFSTTRGGGEHVFKIMAKNLQKNGHKVWIITNKIQDEIYEDSFNIIFVKPTLVYRGALPSSMVDNLRYTFNTVLQGLKTIRKEKIDIIHSNNFSPALAGSILSSLTLVPHITTVHDIFSLCGKNYWKLWGKQSGVSKTSVTLAPFFERLITKFNHVAIHTVSEATRDDLIKMGEKKPIHVIHNTIESVPLNIQHNNHQFSYVGRLVFYKNLEVVINAISIIKDHNIKLVIAGEGPFKKTLQDMVRKLGLEHSITFLGHVSEEEKNKIIASSAAFVFPSLCEGFGLVILEAFSQGKPVLASGLRPMSDIIEHNKTGYLIDPYDPNAWSNYMLETIKDPNKTEEMGKTAIKELEKYTQNSMYEKTIAMYKSYFKQNQS